LLACKLDESLRLGSFERGHRFQELVEREASRQVINQHLHWNPGSPETGGARHAVGVYPDHLFQTPKKFRPHKSNVQHTAIRRKELLHIGAACGRTHPQMSVATGHGNPLIS
jgi:hypothetical protein